MMRSLTVLPFAAALALTACASSPSLLSNCNPPEGWEQLAERGENAIVVFGEIHGTNEIPAAFAEYACAVSTQPGETLVALEIAAQHQPAIDRAFASNDPRQSLLDGMADQWAYQDGKGSEAWLSVITRLAELEDAGHDIRVTTFIDFSPADIEAMQAGGGQDVFEAAYARNIEAAASSETARTIVLVGNLHAMKETIEGLPFTPMTAQLPETTVSLNYNTVGGVTWTMEGGEAAVRDVKASRTNLGDTSAPAIVLTDQAGPLYDGFVFVGPLTPSLPVLEAEKE
jgi:hypothetical protein